MAPPHRVDAHATTSRWSPQLRRSGVGRPLVLLHGFAQTGRCWGPLAEELAAQHEVVTLDLPGHGDAADAATLGLPSMVAPLATAGGTAAWLGYSMGARVALRVALDAPEAVTALVLIGGTAGIEHERERTARAALDEERALRVERLGTAGFLREWLSMDMFSGLPQWARFDDERTRNTPEGLAGSLRHAGTGAMEPLWSRLGELDVPVCCVVGSLDSAYLAHAERIASEVHGPSEVVVVDGAGHAAHLERPAEVAAAVRSFLSRR